MFYLFVANVSKSGFFRLISISDDAYVISVQKGKYLVVNSRTDNKLSAVMLWAGFNCIKAGSIDGTFFNLRIP